MNIKTLSCGVMVVDKENRILMLHATGQNFWDIPKGTQDPGESPLETTVRELREETNLSVNPNDLVELGWYPYNRHKDLFLFMLVVDEINTLGLSCHSSFFNDDGAEVLEADDFEMVGMDLFDRQACNSMARLYQNALKDDLKIMLRRAREKSPV